MASPEWLEIYAGFTDAELDAEIASLKRQNSVFSSQTVGSKSYTKDLAALKDKLAAATRGRAGRGGQKAPRVILTDFGGIAGR